MDKAFCDVMLSQGNKKDSPPPTPLLSAAPPQEYPGDPAIIARFFCTVRPRAREGDYTHYGCSET